MFCCRIGKLTCSGSTIASDEVRSILMISGCSGAVFCSFTVGGNFVGMGVEPGVGVLGIVVEMGGINCSFSIGWRRWKHGA